MNSCVMNIRCQFRWLKNLYHEDPVPSDTGAWNKANVVIVARKAESRVFCSDRPVEQYVRTPHVEELTWVFKAVEIIFSKAGMLDDISKYSIFGRMAAAVNTVLLFCPLAPAVNICMSAINEAEEIFFDMEGPGTDSRLAISS